MNTEQNIAEKIAAIKADSYQKVASLGGWSGGGRTLWAVSAFAMVIGAAIGLAAPFFPLIVGASSLATAVSAIPASVAAFAATGLSSGFAGGVMLGRISGVAAAVAEEQEKRLKTWTARQLLHQNPQAEILPDPAREQPSSMPLGQRLREGWRTYFNPRVGLLFTALGVIGGLVMGAAAVSTGAGAFAIMPALEALTGLETAALTAPVIMAYTAGVSGAIGALWHFNVPKIASAITAFTGYLISGKPLGREWGPKREKLHSPTQAYYNQDVTIADGIIREATAGQAPKPNYASFQELIARQTAGADLGMKR